MIERFFAGSFLALILALAAPVAAQTRQIVLVSSEAVAQTGLWAYVLPRFALKTGIRVELVTAGSGRVADMAASGEADVFITEASGDGWRGIMFMGDPGTGDATRFAVAPAEPGLRPPANGPWAEKFRAWLISDIGQRTIAGFRRDEVQVFFPGVEEEVQQAAPVSEGDPVAGEKLALKNCGRCHVVSEKNRYGGIDSTPSFPGLLTIADWRERFAHFWTLNPHPSFTQIEGVTEPFDPARPPAIEPIRLTIDEVDHIGAFLATIKPKDLGQKLRID